MIASASPDFVTVTVGVLGGLSFFLFGIGQMSEALRVMAGGRLRDLLGRLTKNRVTAAATGAVVTAIIQSSSVTTVLLVGFISAGLMTLSQSVGVILGANIGSTFTAQIIAFKVTQYALPLVILGFGFLFFGRDERWQRAGSLIMGFGMLFFGMEMMGGATAELRSYPPFIDAMREIDNPVLAIGIGAFFTAVIQSSAATAGIVIVLASQGLLSLDAGIAVVIGSNIGTCATAILAALGKQREAMRAALVHVIFNVFGALIWVGLIGVLADLVRVISPAHAELHGTARLAAETPRQIANAHTIFNVLNMLLFLPFTVPLALLVQRIFPEREEEVEEAKAKYLDDVYLGTPALAIERIRLETGRLGETLADVVGSREPLRSEAVTKRLADADCLAGEIMEYARRLGARRLPRSDVWHLEHLLTSLTYLQSIADTLRYNARELSVQLETERVQPSRETRAMFAKLIDRVTDAVRQSVRAVGDLDLDAAANVIRMKRRIVKLGDRLAWHLGQRLMTDDPDRLSTYRIEAQAIEVYKRIYYFAKRIARTVAEDVEELEVPSVGDDP